MYSLFVKLRMFLYSLCSMALDPNIWGPHYWFTLHTIALSYPNFPNDVVKKKYFEFIQNIPLFIPVEEIGNHFSRMLDKYPVTPYLDSRQSFIKWVHFIHNKVNTHLNKSPITLDEAMNIYYEHYKPQIVKNITDKKRREKITYACIICFLITIGIYLSTK